MSIEQGTPHLERVIARTKETLPPLRSDFVRVVHLTGHDQVAGILNEGLDYSRHGMLGSTARAYGNAEDAEFSSGDPRFSGPKVVAVVMDIPMQEHRLHETVGQTPGKVPPEYIVGVIESV